MSRSYLFLEHPSCNRTGYEINVMLIEMGSNLWAICTSNTVGNNEEV